MAHITRFIRAHGRQSIIAAVVVVALAVGGVAYAVANTGGSSGSKVAAVPPATSPPTTTSAPAPKKRHPVLRGQLTAIAPGNWTVRTRTGQTISVVVTAQTQFGSRKAPLTSTQFTVGDRILVSGPQTATTVLAARIAKPPVKAPGTTTSTTATTAPGGASAG